MKKFSLSLHARQKHQVTEGIDGYDWDESQPKWPVTRIMNTAFCIISIIVWILIMVRIFASGNSEYEKMILLNDKSAPIYPAECSEVLRINSATEKDADGGVLIHYPVYLEKAQNLQLTARINRRNLKPKGDGLGYTFVIRESGGDETRFYPLSYYSEDQQFQYTFFRLCFDGIELDSKKVYTFLVFCGDVSPTDGEYPAEKADFRFTVLNSETYCNMVVPKKSVYKKAK